MGQQERSVPVFTWSSILCYLVVRLQVQLGTEYYWAGWMQKEEELLEPWKCSLEEVTSSLLSGAGVEVSTCGVRGKYFRQEEEGET